MGLSTEEGEILAAWGILKFFNVGIVACKSLAWRDSLILPSSTRLFPKVVAAAKFGKKRGKRVVLRQLTFAARIGSVRFVRFQSLWS